MSASTDTILAGNLVDWPGYERAGAGIGLLASLPNEAADLGVILSKVAAEELPRKDGEDALRRFAGLCAAAQSFAVQRGLVDFVAPCAASAAAAIELLNHGPAAWVVE